MTKSTFNVEQLEKVFHGISPSMVIGNVQTNDDSTASNTDLLARLKADIAYLEKNKYHDGYKVTTASAKINNEPVDIFYVDYTDPKLEISSAQFEHMNNQTIKLRQLSILAGIVYMLNQSDHYLTKDAATRQNLLHKLNIIEQNLNRKNDFINGTLDEAIERFVDEVSHTIMQTCGIDQSEVTRAMRNAERYFLAEQNKQRVYIFRANIANQATYQVDIPFGNQLTLNQKKEYLKIHSSPPNNPPSWFPHLEPWEKDWLLTVVPKTLDGDWTKFNDLYQSSAMQHLPGIKNARTNYLLTGTDELSIVSKSFKTATLVPYEMPNDSKNTNTLMNVNQLLDHLSNQATEQFNAIWGNIGLPSHIKPLVLVNSLLSDTAFSAADTALAENQLEAIKLYASLNAGKVTVISGNDPVNFFRALAYQGQSRWGYAKQLIDYANVLKDHLNILNIVPTKDQQARIDLSMHAAAQLEALMNMDKSEMMLNLSRLRNFEAFKTAYVSILTEALGGAVSTNCKSGKDRTGLDELYRQAMLIYYNEYQKLPGFADTSVDRENFNEIFTKLFNTMKTQEAAAKNTPGSFGLKDSARMLCFDISTKLEASYQTSNQRANMNKPPRFIADEAAQMREISELTKVKGTLKTIRDESLRVARDIVTGTVTPQPVVDVTTQNQLRSRSAQQQFENDAKQWNNYLSPDNSKATFEKQLIMKRLFSIINETGLSTTNGSETVPQDNHPNLAGLLSHGGRLVIQVPPIKPGENPHELVDTLLHGININKKDRFGQPILFGRPFASHSLKNENGVMTEELLKTSGLEGDYFKLIKDSLNNRHFGMNIGLGHNGAQDEDGTNGHVYFYWKEPTELEPGGLMIGVETSAPGKTNPYGATHGAGAVSGEFTSTGGTKFRSDAFIKQKEAGFILSPENGMRVDINRTDFKNVINAIGHAHENITPEILSKQELSIRPFEAKHQAAPSLMKQVRHAIKNRINQYMPKRDPARPFTPSPREKPQINHHSNETMFHSPLKKPITVEFNAHRCYELLKIHRFKDDHEIALQRKIMDIVKDKPLNLVTVGPILKELKRDPSFNNQASAHISNFISAVESLAVAKYNLDVFITAFQQNAILANVRQEMNGDPILKNILNIVHAYLKKPDDAHLENIAVTIELLHGRKTLQSATDPRAAWAYNLLALLKKNNDGLLAPDVFQSSLDKHLNNYAIAINAYKNMSKLNAATPKDGQDDTESGGRKAR